jgi:SAM-dependent methyltransferase
MKILDLACAMPTRPTNWRNWDISDRHRLDAGFLKIANQDARKTVKVIYLKGDMRHLTFQNEFDRVILMFTAFGYFSDEENYLVLQNVARALKPGGLFCFDTHNRDMILKGMIPYAVVEKGKDLLIDRHEFNSVSGRLINRRIIIRNGRRKDTPFFVRFYSLYGNCSIA